MEFQNQYIDELRVNLSTIDPYLVVLFGSFVYGIPNKDSDLDVCVVLNDQTLPTTFKEKQDLYLKVSPLTRPVARKIPIDLLVFTIPLFEAFKKSNTNFSKEILTKGFIIYESKHKKLA